MTLKSILIFAGGLGLVSCNPSENSRLNENGASGVYAREYSSEVIHPETGDRLGIRKIRDSIFVQAADEGYEISNHKWRLNDYDQEGWVSMQYADDRPLPTYIAAYDENSKLLTSKNSNVSQSIFLDIENGKLFKNKSRDIEYLKVK